MRRKYTYTKADTPQVPGIIADIRTSLHLVQDINKKVLEFNKVADEQKKLADEIKSIYDKLKNSYENTGDTVQSVLDSQTPPDPEVASLKEVLILQHKKVGIARQDVNIVMMQLKKLSRFNDPLQFDDAQI